MGQRLNLEITNNGELLANCYYHWSGYTHDAMGITTDALDALDNMEGDLSPKQKAIIMLLDTGAMACNEDLVLCKSIMRKVKGFDFPERNVNRNEGLIGVIKESMEETRNWEEARVTIDIGKEEIDFNVVYCADEEDLEWARKDGKDVVVDDLNYYLREIPFKDWDSFKDDLEDCGHYFQDLDYDCIYGKIE